MQKIHTQELLPSIPENDKNTSTQTSDEKPRPFNDDKESCKSSRSSSEDSTASASNSEDDQVEVFVNSDTPFIREKVGLLTSQKNNSAEVINIDPSIESTTIPNQHNNSNNEIKTKVVKKVTIKSNVEGNHSGNRQKAEVTSSTINKRYPRPSTRKSKTRSGELNMDSNDVTVRKKHKDSAVCKPELKKAYSVSKLYNTQSSADSNDTGTRNKYCFEFKKCKCEFLKLVVDQPRTRKRRKVSNQRRMLERDIKVLLEDPFLRKHLSGGLMDYRIAIPKLRFPHPSRHRRNRSKRRPKSAQSMSKI